MVSGALYPEMIAERSGQVRIIPVLDLKDGQVVRAAQGRRDRYRPITTPLCRGSDPLAVASGLRRLSPFPTFYIADLNAIAGGAPDSDSTAALREIDPPPLLWVDAGIADAAALASALALPATCPVIGSESQRDTALLARFCTHPNVILSLDFFADGFHGPTALLDEPDLWPATVVVMTLAKVGSADGPDLARLAEIKAAAGKRMVIAAGGVRNATDIEALARLGISGALVATSLHDGTLTPEELARLSA